MLIKPFGFAGAGGVSEWDPTLDGDLTINYWYDFTSNDYVTLSGSSTNVLDILPRQKPAGETGEGRLHDASGTSKGYTNPVEWNTNFNIDCININNAALFSGSDSLNLNWIPSGSTNNDEWSAVCITATDDWQDRGTTNSIAAWNITATGDGYDSLNLFINKNGGLGSSCSGSGDFDVAYGNYNGSNWNDTRFQNMTANPSGSSGEGYVPNMYSTTFSGDSNPADASFTVNNRDECSGLSFTKASGNSCGLCIAAAPTFTSANSYNGRYWHFITYKGILTEAQMKSLYDTWREHYLALAP
jgi:hypothetical protein